MKEIPKWSDLGPRLLSGVVIAVLGIGGVWMGGASYIAMVSLVTALLVWEIGRMTNPAQRVPAWQLGALAFGAMILTQVLPPVFVVPVTLAPALVGVGLLRRHRGLFFLYALWVLLAGLGFFLLRVQGGVIWMLWLVLVVVASDIAGYFVGKSLGGPKFWPRISPKKTWSGTLGGWALAGLVGAIFVLMGKAGPHLIWVSMVVAFAAQMGDIAESTLKRRMGIKDSSQLIPGHGGVFDRFDGMVGAAVLLLFMMAFNMLHLAAF